MDAPTQKLHWTQMPKHKARLRRLRRLAGARKRVSSLKKQSFAERVIAAAPKPAVGSRSERRQAAPFRFCPYCAHALPVMR